MENTLNTEASVLPEAQKRNPYVYAVIYRDSDGKLALVECENRKAALDLVNSLGLDKVLKVYRVSQVVELKPKTVITF